MKNNSITLKTLFKSSEQKGNLVYEYNPLKNLRASTSIFKYKGKLYSSLSELFKEDDTKSFKGVEINSNSNNKIIEEVYLIKDGIKILFSDGFIITFDSLAQLLNYLSEEKLFNIVYKDLSDILIELLLTKYVDWEDEIKDVIITFLKELVLNEELSYVNFILPINDEKNSLNEDDAKLLNYKESIWSSGETPITINKGQLIDFDTAQLNVDLNSPVNMITQESYDVSVNLILNDGKNTPKLINTRFSPLGNSTYEIVDRIGNLDTNIYDTGTKFPISTSLYKNISKLPEIKFFGTYSGGNLKVGSYCLYFKLTDADGNLSDFIGETRPIQIFIGSLPASIHSGFRDENSYKKLSINITNIDSAYSYVKVYYTRTTSDVYTNYSTEAVEVLSKYPINNNNSCWIDLTGNESIAPISLEDLNTQYEVYTSIKALEVVKNRLFIGNVKTLDLSFNELRELSLHFLPYCNYDIKNEILSLGSLYDNISKLKNTYYDPVFTYNYTGYWNKEIYRFGIVYIYENGSLSPVFNIRGIVGLNNDTKYTETKLGEIKINDDGSINAGKYLENAFGVVQFDLTSDYDKILGISLKTSKEVIEKLNDLNIKGFFFVRQKRVPTILCQALVTTLDGDKLSNGSGIPLIYCKDGYSIWESIVDGDNILTHDLENHTTDKGRQVLGRKRTTLTASSFAAFCPEYDVNSPYFNSLFNGNEYIIRQSEHQNIEKGFIENYNNKRQYYTSLNSFDENKSTSLSSSSIIGVEDNVKLVSIDNIKFRARAGEAELFNHFEYFGRNGNEDASSKNQPIRGSYGPYLGLSTNFNPGTFIDIMIPNYSSSYIEEYFKIRYRDNSAFYAISDRFSLLKFVDKNNSDIVDVDTIYGGDCYLSLFTHRVNRNFQDPSAPTNDKIVDPKSYNKGWVWDADSKFFKEDEENKVNLGDLNAVKLGLWVTFPIKSSMNLCIRGLDSSNVDESLLFGRDRGFFPYTKMIPDGTYKIPEAGVYNKGLTLTTSEKVYVNLSDVPVYYNNFLNRVAYSDININNSFVNNFRVFPKLLYREYTALYGAITKFVNVDDDLLCICERGVLHLKINERIAISQDPGDPLYINTKNVLPETPVVISDTYGSQWPESIIKTDRGVYGIDTQAKKIWRIVGGTLLCISDFYILEFLNNILLKERDTKPIIGIRNVKTHYNKTKHDIMFTFYNYLNGFENNVWNICFNEILNKWVTFYSWVPSYSENISNIFFSFNAETSKAIAKLGTSHTGNKFSEGITLDNNIIPLNSLKKSYYVNELGYFDNESSDELNKQELILVGKLSVEADLIAGYPKDHLITYTLELDNYNNNKNFKILKNKDKDGNEESYLFYSGDVKDLCSAIYAIKEKEGNREYSNDNYDKNVWKELLDTPENIVTIKESKSNRIIHLNYNYQINNQIITLLNISAYVLLKDEANYEDFINSKEDFIRTNVNYFKYTVAVIPDYNIQFLSTDFWKHGLAGIIDISDKLLPTHWYGKLNPFEFEFVVANNPGIHKIFDNLEIISNKAAPESFHYEIIGECYDFAKDKENMYIRQEATKELYLYNGSDIVYDSNYKKLNPNKFDKSTVFPLYYSRRNTINEVEDYYHLYTENNSSKNFSGLAGAEIVKYDNLNEYRIWNHSKAVDINKEGILRGNMYYKEDKWDVLINPINLVLKNELDKEWIKDTPPVVYNLFPLPEDINDVSELKIPNSINSVTIWNNITTANKEVKLKDKFIKIRIRYSGEDLAIISAIRTLYSISFA